jgi:hypothetical protein
MTYLLSLFALTKRLFRRAALRQVARDFGETDKSSRRVADRVDNDVRPKVGAVFSHLPALSLETAFPARRRTIAVA